ncbi:rab GTPase-activating protein 1-like isoform X3 [Homalodisca vitripennis]|uniref:rab GTPase-activating protein 1-like isoform X3 n=1 Tax=Homalodisca vitripennis TaxID=197043 RepID=UPI001EEA8F38|nr:rab GTPase-activating protein 1-like isoform X3 [Homalodisca vitripennis]
MEDSASVKSNDSTAVSDEYEFVASTVSSLPLLKITGDNSLEAMMGEVLGEMDIDNKLQQTPTEAKPRTYILESKRFETDEHPLSEEEVEEIEDVSQDCTIFNGISYLGSASVNAPKSQTETNLNMAILNEQSHNQEVIKVSVSVPSCSDGSVVLYDAATGTVMARYEIHRIVFYAHGLADSKETACFSFTYTQGGTIESYIFQCHVFRCDIPEAVGQVSSCFNKAFQRVPRSMTTSVQGELLSADQAELMSRSGSLQMFVFEVTMEIKEEDGRGGFSAVPKDRNCFKLRMNVEKQVCLTVQQVMGDRDKDQDMEVERCFGVLISPGRNVKHSDMQLLEMVSMGSGSVNDKKCYVITGQCSPRENAFEPLNVETPRDTRMWLTVAVDLVVRGIKEPVRLVLETQVKVFPAAERFWTINRRPLVQQFTLNLKEVLSPDINESTYEVISIEPSEPSPDLDHRNRLNLTLNNLASFIQSPSVNSIDTLTPKEEEYCSDGDEPILSGTGEVSKDCTEVELEYWAEVLAAWTTPGQRPRQLSALVRKGIPEALRGEVWQRLAQCSGDDNVMDLYRILITKECSCENVIKRDINRTYPAHEFFKKAGGVGQDSLLRISKAYAVYDTEVSYCQGLSFLAASLLLHMPEEQAFCVLLKLMYDYGLRDLYKDGFECLYLRLYQLNRLMEEQVPTLLQHFSDKGVETHMFASQWFLTLFTARFPLYFVYLILDVFLLQGTETLFQVALALLIMYKKDLMQLDFESILKYFRVTLPKRCLNEDTARQLMKMACNIKIKRLKKYEQEFLELKAHQDKDDQYDNEVERLKTNLQRTEDEKKRLEEELSKVKEILKKEVQKAENDSNRHISIISEYKQICQRLDCEQLAAKAALDQLKVKVAGCERCRDAANSSVSQAAGDEASLTQRIKELELELARTKLSQVEAECRNQDLTHQLATTVGELQALSAHNAWPPWLHKPLSDNFDDNRMFVVGPDPSVGYNSGRTASTLCSHCLASLAP